MDDELSPLRNWLIDKIIEAFPSQDSVMASNDGQFKEWTGVDQKWLDGQWADEARRRKNGEDPKVVGCTTTCKDLLIKVVQLIRKEGHISIPNTFPPNCFDLPKAGKVSGAWHYIGEADGILMPRPGDFFQAQNWQAEQGQHVGIILEFDFSHWCTLESGQGGPPLDMIKRRGPEQIAGRRCLGWLDIDTYFQGWQH